MHLNNGQQMSTMPGEMMRRMPNHPLGSAEGGQNLPNGQANSQNLDVAHDFQKNA